MGQSRAKLTASIIPPDPTHCNRAPKRGDEQRMFEQTARVALAIEVGEREKCRRAQRRQRQGETPGEKRERGDFAERNASFSKASPRESGGVVGSVSRVGGEAFMVLNFVASFEFRVQSSAFQGRPIAVRSHHQVHNCGDEASVMR